MGFLDQTAPTRWSSSGTATPPSRGCSTPTSRRGSRCSPTRTPCVETSRTVFETVRQYWATLPASEPPQALPLRALPGVDRGREHAQLGQHHQRAGRRRAHGRPAVRQRDAPPARARARQPGSRHTSPSTSRAAPRASPPSRRAWPRDQDWGPTRLVYLQHASDPIVFFSPSLAFSSPEWLKDGERGPDVVGADGVVPARDDVAGPARPAGRRQHPDGLRPPLLRHGQPRVLGRGDGPARLDAREDGRPRRPVLEKRPYKDT